MFFFCRNATIDVLQPIPPIKPPEREELSDLDLNPQPPRQPPSRLSRNPDAVLVNQLLDMGFDYNKAVWALEQTNNNLDQAIELLTN